MKLLYLLNRVKLSLKHSGIRQTFKKIVHTILKGNKIDLDDLLEESPKTLDEIFIKFGTDKGSLDGKKTYYHYYRFKESNFNSYLNWIQRKNIKNYKYQLGLNSTSLQKRVQLILHLIQRYIQNIILILIKQTILLRKLLITKKIKNQIMELIILF